MKRIVIFTVCLAVMVFAAAASAEETCQQYDPLKRNLIFVEGEAEITVPVDGFSLMFDFDIEKAAFKEASTASNQIVDSISDNIKGMGLSNVEIIKGWDIVKQGKIAIGDKGRKISNRLVVRVFGYPKGELHDTIAEIIDKSLAVDKAITLKSIEVLISDDVENKKKEEVLSAALKALQSNAKCAADALGAKLTGTKRVFITNEEEVYKLEGQSWDARYAPEQVLSKSVVSIQKSFRVNAEIVDNIKFIARVSGIYEVE